MKGVQNIDERRIFIQSMTSIGVPLTLHRVGGTLTLNMNGTPLVNANINEIIFEMDVSDIVDDAYINQDFIVGRYYISGATNYAVAIFNVAISDGLLTLTTKTLLTGASILAFQAVVMI